MNGPLARRPAALTFVHCLRRATGPMLVAAGLGALLHATTGDATADLGAAAGANTPWLHLPLLVTAFACAAAAAGFWPLFAARQPGREHVARLQRGPLGGSGAVLAGAVLAQFVLTLPLTTVFARLLGAPATALARHTLTGPEQPLLTASQPRLVFGAGGHTLGALDLRPVAGPPTGAFAPTRVRVHLDGSSDPVAEVPFAETLQHVRVDLPGRPVQTIELAYADGTVPLWFAPGAVVAVETAARSGLWNGVLTACVGLLPAFVALALALLCGRAATLPTVRAALGGILFVGTVGGAGPADTAVLALLRGHAVATAVTFSACVPSLAAGSLAMIGAMLWRRRSSR